MSGMLLTYCVFGSSATELIKQLITPGSSRGTVVPAVISALTAFAATAGVALGAILAS